MDFSGWVPMEITYFEYRWRSWEGCCRKQTNSKPYLLLTPGSISSLFCCWPMTLSNKLKMIVVVVHLFFDQLFNAQPVDGAVSNQYQVIFECVSGQSSYFSCNVASLFWRQDLWGILRHFHPVTKSWKRSQKTLPKAERTRGLSSSFQSNLLSHITSSNTNVDQTSSSKYRPSIYFKILKFKILTKPSFSISIKIQLRNLCKTSAAKYWPNSSLKILPELQHQNLEQTLCSKSEQKFGFITKPQLPSMQQIVANTIFIINISKSANLNKFWVGTSIKSVSKLQQVLSCHLHMPGSH